MLVLSRQRDESIMIGDNIVVTIVDIRGDKVRLGINAPAEIPVHRQEVYEAIQRDNQRAARLQHGDTQDIGKLAGRGNGGPGRPPEPPRH
jgi:carbon storage regulator